MVDSYIKYMNAHPPRAIAAVASPPEQARREHAVDGYLHGTIVATGLVRT